MEFAIDKITHVIALDVFPYFYSAFKINPEELRNYDMDKLDAVFTFNSYFCCLYGKYNPMDLLKLPIEKIESLTGFGVECRYRICGISIEDIVSFPTEKIDVLVSLAADKFYKNKPDDKQKLFAIESVRGIQEKLLECYMESYSVTDVSAKDVNDEKMSLLLSPFYVLTYDQGIKFTDVIHMTVPEIIAYSESISPSDEIS